MHKNALFSYQHPQNYLDLASSTLMQQITFKTYSKHTCNIHLQWGFHLNTLYFSSIGILYTIKRRKKVFKYIQKKKESKKNQKDKSGNRKVFNLNPVPQRTNKTSSINVALLQTMRKFTTLVFPHLINVTKVLHYKIGQL